MIPPFQFRPYTAPYNPAPVQNLSSAIESKNVKWDEGEKLVNAARDLGLVDVHQSDIQDRDIFAKEIEAGMDELLAKYDGFQHSSKFQRDMNLFIRQKAADKRIKAWNEAAKIREEHRKFIASNPNAWDQSEGMDQPIIRGYDENGEPIIQMPSFRAEILPDITAIADNAAKNVIGNLPKISGFVISKDSEGKPIIRTQEGKYVDITNPNDPNFPKIEQLLDEYYINDFIDPSSPGNAYYRKAISDIQREGVERTEEEVIKLARQRVGKRILSELGKHLSTEISDAPVDTTKTGGPSVTGGQSDFNRLVFRGGLEASEYTLSDIDKKKANVEGLENRKNEYLRSIGLTPEQIQEGIDTGVYRNSNGIDLTKQVLEQLENFEVEVTDDAAFLKSYYEYLENELDNNPELNELIKNINLDEERLVKFLERQHSKTSFSGAAAKGKDELREYLKDPKNREKTIDAYLSSKYGFEVTSLSKRALEQTNQLRTGLTGLLIPIMNIPGANFENDRMSFTGIQSYLGGESLAITDSSGKTVKSENYAGYEMLNPSISFKPNGDIELVFNAKVEGQKEVKSKDTNLRMVGENAKSVLIQIMGGGQVGQAAVNDMIKNARRQNTLGMSFNYARPDELRNIPSYYLSHLSYQIDQNTGNQYKDMNLRRYLASEMADYKVSVIGGEYYLKIGENESKNVGDLEGLDYELRKIASIYQENYINNKESINRNLTNNSTRTSTSNNRVVETTVEPEYLNPNGEISYQPLVPIDLKIDGIPIRNSYPDSYEDINITFQEGINNARREVERTFDYFQDLDGVDSQLLTNYFYNMIYKESNGDLTIKSKNSSAYGLIQMIDDNRKKFNTWYKKEYGKEPKEEFDSRDPYRMLDVAIKELQWFYTEGHKGAVEKMKEVYKENPNYNFDELLYFSHLVGGGDKMNEVIKNTKNSNTPFHLQKVYKVGEKGYEGNKALDKTKKGYITAQDIFNYYSVNIKLQS